MTYRVRTVTLQYLHRGHSEDAALETQLNALPSDEVVVSVEKIASLYFRVVTAQGIEARSDETQSGSAVGESPVAESHAAESPRQLPPRKA